MVKGRPVMWQAIQAGAGKKRGEEILVRAMHVVTMPSVITVWMTCHVISTHHRYSLTSSFICCCPCGLFVVLCLLCQKKGSGREAILLTWMLSIVHCHLTKGDMAPALHVNKERWGIDVAHLDIVRRSFVVGCHVADGDLAPVLCVKKERGRGGIFLTSIILRTVTTTCIISIWTTWHVC